MSISADFLTRMQQQLGNDPQARLVRNALSGTSITKSAGSAAGVRAESNRVS